MYKKKILIVCGVLLIFLLTGCQKSPSNQVITSKNDGTFESNILSTSTGNNFADGHITISKNFCSSDDSVQFTMNIDQTIPTMDMPVAKVTPHFLTADDAKRIATAFFPDAIFYEAEPPQAENLSKNEIQEKIHRWSEYTSIDALRNLYGDAYSEATLEQLSEIVKKFIGDYTLMYEEAPESSGHVLCKWEMRKTLEYMLSDEERKGIDISDCNDEISAQFVSNGIPYYYTVATRNSHDFKVNMISIYPYAGMGPINLDENIYHSLLTRTDEPTEQEVDIVKSKAEQMLSDMELGQWKIDECYVERQFCGDIPEYTIHINAVPVVGHIPVLRHPQYSSLKNESGYAPEQYITDVNLVFSPDGKLILFNLFTPIEEPEIVNANVNVMGVNQLLDRAEELLRLTDCYAFGFGNSLQFIDEPVRCNVRISKLKYGLSRIKVRDQEDMYYYTPSMVLEGNIEYVGQTSGKTFYSSGETERLLCINAVDGTVINQTNT